MVIFMIPHISCISSMSNVPTGLLRSGHNFTPKIWEEINWVTSALLPKWTKLQMILLHLAFCVYRRIVTQFTWTILAVYH